MQMGVAGSDCNRPAEIRSSQLTHIPNRFSSIRRRAASIRCNSISRRRLVSADMACPCNASMRDKRPTLAWSSSTVFAESRPKSRTSSSSRRRCSNRFLYPSVFWFETDMSQWLIQGIFFCQLITSLPAKPRELPRLPAARLQNHQSQDGVCITCGDPDRLRTIPVYP